MDEADGSRAIGKAGPGHQAPAHEAAREIDRLPPGVLAAFDAIGGKWKIPILFLLWQRGRRFGELRRALPRVTQHMLTASLRELEADGLVTRTVHAEVPPRVEYALAPEHGLCDTFIAMNNWGARLAGTPQGG